MTNYLRAIVKKVESAKKGFVRIRIPIYHNKNIRPEDLPLAEPKDIEKLPNVPKKNDKIWVFSETGHKKGNWIYDGFCGSETKFNEINDEIDDRYAALSQVTVNGSPSTDLTGLRDENFATIKKIILNEESPADFIEYNKESGLYIFHHHSGAIYAVTDSGEITEISGGTKFLEADLNIKGSVDIEGNLATNVGWSGTFIAGTKTVTVMNGIIVNVV